MDMLWGVEKGGNVLWGFFVLVFELIMGILVVVGNECFEIIKKNEKNKVDKGRSISVGEFWGVFGVGVMPQRKKTLNL